MTGRRSALLRCPTTPPTQWLSYVPWSCKWSYPLLGQHELEIPITHGSRDVPTRLAKYPSSCPGLLAWIRVHFVRTAAAVPQGQA